MIYLILAIASSALISIFMRLSEQHIKNEMGMFMANYALCALLAVGFMDKSGPILGAHDQHLTVIIGIICKKVSLCFERIFKNESYR